MWLALKRKVIDAKFDHAGVFIPTGRYKIALVALNDPRSRIPIRVLSGGPTSTLFVSVKPSDGEVNSGFPA